MPARRHHFGIVAELMQTPHGKAWGLTSPDNGFEGYALQCDDGTWEQYADLWALGKRRSIFHGFARLTDLMEGIARANEDSRRLEAEWAEQRKTRQGSIADPHSQEQMMPEQNSKTALANLRKILTRIGAQIDGNEKPDGEAIGRELGIAMAITDTLAADGREVAA